VESSGMVDKSGALSRKPEAGHCEGAQRPKQSFPRFVFTYRC
jgi:hypothetical protein